MSKKRNYWKAKYRGSICIPGGHGINVGTEICVWGDRRNKVYACRRCVEKEEKRKNPAPREKAAVISQLSLF